MSTDVTPDIPSEAKQAKTQRPLPLPDAKDVPRARWWKRSLLATSAIVLAGAAATQITGLTSREPGPQLTHVITRGDLFVTVTEQGTLESSENTEIKCKVRGQNTVTFVVESGTHVEPGDVLVRLDTLFIEEQIAERTKYAHWSRSAAERSKADVVTAGLAVKEYLEGRFVAELMTLQKDLAIAEANLRTAQNMLSHAKMMSKSGYVSELEVEEKTFAVERGKLAVDVNKTNIDVLEKYTRAEQLETLKGNLAAVKATHEANVERAEADASRRDRALEELGYCVVRAERSGMVIHPKAAQWKDAPEIEEGANVHKDQILLLMPDLSQMQVKVGIHESIVDRMEPGLTALVSLPDETIEGEVSTVASITSPAGWWTGNVVKYDTIIKLPSEEGLKPGMSAEVEIIIAQYQDVLTIPVAAVIEIEEGHFCWVQTAQGTERRTLTLGDSNDIFMVVQDGLREGEEVVLNPLAFVEEAQMEVLKPSNDGKLGESGDEESQTGGDPSDESNLLRGTEESGLDSQ